MRIVSLELRCFRNHHERRVEPAEGLTVLVGPNAAGKTNLLEAVAVAARGESFRRGERADLVEWGQRTAAVRLRAEEGRSATDVRVVIGLDGARIWELNGKPRRAAGAAPLPLVVFTPDDLGLVKGPADARRTAVDDIGRALSGTYARTARDHARAVRQRNTLLKEERCDARGLEAWDLETARLGAELTAARARLLTTLAPAAEEAMASISGEELRFGYEDRAGLGDSLLAGLPVDRIGEALLAGMHARRAEEVARGVTLVGPHRDDIVFRVGGRDARTLASQGQQRSAVLAWKAAESRVVRDVSGRRPIVLLDDVMSELDETRRAALTGLLREGSQTLVTTTGLGYFADGFLEGAAIVKVNGDA